MKYTIDCVGTPSGWRYRVTLWYGRTGYSGHRTYKRYQGALRAARATGLTEREWLV